jgi:hypothetical protein
MNWHDGHGSLSTNHGRAVHITQEKRRSCLLDMTFGLTDEEALWAALNSSATFQPRKSMPRQDPGHLFYPNKSSHIFEKY